MTLTRAFTAVGWCTAACALAGVAAGAAVGQFCPDYYAAMVPGRAGQQFNPVQLGVGFGLNAGVFTGVAIGLIVVVVVAAFELRAKIADRLAGGSVEIAYRDKSDPTAGE